jgi:hypothetical protein
MMVIPFRPRRDELDVQHITRAIFAAIAVAGEQDPETVFKKFRRQHPEIRNVDVRAAFALAYKAMCGFERLLLDPADDGPEGAA